MGHVNPVSTSSAQHHFLLEVGVLERQARGIHCETDGSITVKDHDGVALPYAMLRGEVRSFAPVEVTAITGGGVFYGWD